MSPCFRRHVSQHIREIGVQLKSSPAIIRTFSTGSKLLKQSRPPPLKQSPPPRAPLRTPPSFANSSGSKSSATYAETLIQGNDRVLIYVAPNHNGFYASSYLIGGAFLFGAYSWAQFALKEAPGKDGQAIDQSKQPWYIKTVLTVEILVVVALGTHFILAPSKLIKSIAIVKTATSSNPDVSGVLRLQLEIKRAIPFMRPDVLDTVPSRIFLDRRVATAGENISFTSVPRLQAQKFTSDYFSGAKVTASDRIGGVSGALRSLWPSMRRETRRMFLRDQMAYIRTLDNGHFKLDLQGAAILDEARPLDRLIIPDIEKRNSVLGFIRGVVSA